MIFSVLQKELEKNGIEYKNDFDLKTSSSFRIGGICRIAVFPKSTQQFATAVSLFDMAAEDFCILGRGSNTLLFDGYINKGIIFTTNVNKVKISNTSVIAEAGAALMPLCSQSANEGLSGLEFACGIPGSVGGAVYMNAGAHGGSMSDVVISTRAYDRAQKSIITLTEHEFDYRKSVYSDNSSLICLEAIFYLRCDEPSEIRKRMKELLDSRRQKQPIEYPSAGSYFKRPNGDFAGRLIEITGLKGVAIGGAEVSEKHAGFIINTGNATFEDVIRLEELIKKRVFEQTGVVLEREVEIIR